MRAEPRRSLAGSGAVATTKWQTGDKVAWNDVFDDRPRRGVVTDVLSTQLIIAPTDCTYPTIVKMAEPTLKLVYEGSK